MSDTFRPNKTWSLITIAGLAFIVFFNAGVILTAIGQILNPELVLELDDGESISPWYMIQGLLALFRMPVFIATIVAFLIWLNRAHKNLLALRPTYLRFSSGWAVAWWFIPFANLVKPFQVVREVWAESDPEIPEGQMFLTESLHSAPTYMGFWWAFWLAGNFATNVADKMFDPDRTDNVAAIGIAFIISSSLVIAAGVLAIKVVRDITERQAARFQAVKRLEELETDSQPDADAPAAGVWQQG
jgi:hypothetical protein